jgi:hypothetical protein
LFAPAIALSIVTDISITTGILIIGFIVTLYTSLGGLKGVGKRLTCFVRKDISSFRDHFINNLIN